MIPCPHCGGDVTVVDLATAANRLGVSHRSMQRWAQQQRIATSVIPGRGQRVVTTAELDRFTAEVEAASLPETASAAPAGDG